MKLTGSLVLKKVIPVLGVVILGYSYFYFIGCNSGTCPITGNPYISTFYGSLVVLILVFPMKKKNKNGSEENK